MVISKDTIVQNDGINIKEIQLERVPKAVCLRGKINENWNTSVKISIEHTHRVFLCVKNTFNDQDMCEF